MRAAGSNPATDPALFHLTTTNRGWFVEGLFAVENWDTNLEKVKVLTQEQRESNCTCWSFHFRKNSNQRRESMSPQPPNLLTQHL
jgi:hypothetical protein